MKNEEYTGEIDYQNEALGGCEGKGTAEGKRKSRDWSSVGASRGRTEAAAIAKVRMSRKTVQGKEECKSVHPNRQFFRWGDALVT